MSTGATLFSGFEGAGVGMRAAGVDMRWGIELRADVAAVAEANGFHSIVADILTVDPAAIERVDYLHASPPCTNASVANANAGESELDQALARKVVDFIRELKPEIFTLENVWQYRKFVSFRIILGALEALGYWVDVAHCNSADFGVPQTRKRMILRARLGGMLPILPEPVRRVGWYEAIEDLLDTLPESKFAPWQLERLPEQAKTMLVSQGKMPTGAELIMRGASDPAPTVVASDHQSATRAFLVHATDQRSMPVVDREAPCFTVMSAHGNGNMPRAFLVNGALSTSGDSKTLQTHDDGEPSGTIVSTRSSVKDTRVWLSSGRVVKLTPRALARLQSFPDSYILPSKSSLACFGIGNAVPPLLMEKIYRGMVTP